MMPTTRSSTTTTTTSATNPDPVPKTDVFRHARNSFTDDQKTRVWKTQFWEGFWNRNGEGREQTSERRMFMATTGMDLKTVQNRSKLDRRLSRSVNWRKRSKDGWKQTQFSCG
jgi:hypothetical protein